MFNFYRNRADIICVQETHSSPNEEHIWVSEFGGDILFNHGETNARGVCILMRKGIKQSIKKIKRDLAGRYIICEITIHDFTITLLNVYGPNKDSAPFYEDIALNLQS